MTDNASPDQNYPVLDYLTRMISGTLSTEDSTHLNYPTAISRLLGFEVVAAGVDSASVSVTADTSLHGNQQGTIHGGFLAELADAAIGTACSTTSIPGESFTNMDLNMTFLRPVFGGRLVAEAWVTHKGRTIQHFECRILNQAGKVVATATSKAMTLRGDAAKGR